MRKQCGKVMRGPRDRPPPDPPIKNPKSPLRWERGYGIIESLRETRATFPVRDLTFDNWIWITMPSNGHAIRKDWALSGRVFLWWRWIRGLESGCLTIYAMCWKEKNEKLSKPSLQTQSECGIIDSLRFFDNWEWFLEHWLMVLEVWTLLWKAKIPLVGIKPSSMVTYA